MTTNGDQYIIGLRHIRVAFKAELKRMILAYIDDVDREPVAHTLTYKVDEAA
jgi:hypothetical protein